MTIESAFANVMMGAMNGTPRQAIDAARAAMLAVLDEAESEFMFRGKALRKRIQELDV